MFLALNPTVPGPALLRLRDLNIEGLPTYSGRVGFPICRKWRLSAVAMAGFVQS